MAKQAFIAAIVGILLMTSMNSRLCAHTERSRQTELAASVELGPETLVSTNEDGGTLRCEPWVAIFADTIVTAWNTEADTELQKAKQESPSPGQSHVIAVRRSDLEAISRKTNRATY